MAYLGIPCFKTGCQIFLKLAHKVSCDFWKIGHNPLHPTLSAAVINGVHFWGKIIKKKMYLNFLFSWLLTACHHQLLLSSLTTQPLSILSVLLPLHHHSSFHLHLGSAEENNWTVLRSQERLALRLMVLCNHSRFTLQILILLMSFTFAEKNLAWVVFVNEVWTPEAW